MWVHTRWCVVLITDCGFWDLVDFHHAAGGIVLYMGGVLVMGRFSIDGNFNGSIIEAPRSEVSQS